MKRILLERAYRKNVSQAKSRNIVWLLGYDEWDEVVTGPCYYCGKENSKREYDSGRTMFVGYNGIDRIDSDDGYVVGNVVSCCKECNYMKRDMELEEWYYHMETILRNIKPEIFK
jgi:hypothetical protein